MRPIATNIYIPKRGLRLYSDIVNDSLTEFAYDAELAGLKYSLRPHFNGLLLTFRGYNDKISVLVAHILEKVKGLVVDAQRLSVMKQQVTFSLFLFPVY
jgi:insulysin